ncbi:MAG: hypothetical protein KDC90_11790 [Ignavibacteriae bacterium]|nr:hypothetical protein [Ignavibacteriota bacterium]
MFDLTSFNFDQFTSKEKYCALQSKFLNLDERDRYTWALEEPLPDAMVDIKVFDTLEGKDDYFSKSLLGDFILPGVNLLAFNHFRTFRSKIHSKGLYMKEQVDGLAKVYLNKINETKSIIEKADFISEEIRGLVVLQLDLLTERLENYISNPYPLLKEKLQFNWNRTDVIFFFNLLRLNKQIGHIEDADLGRIIDNVCEYNNGKEYTPIRESRKHLTSFKNFTERPQEETLKRLKEIFTSDDFYALK